MSYTTLFNCLKASTVALLLLFFQPLIAQQKYESLSKLLETKKSSLGKDYAVLIAGADSIYYQKEAGDMKVKTVAPIASASKWLTAALVMQFVDEGKLSLDDKVAQYLPVFEKYGKNYITLRHCLSHLTGIKSDGGFAEQLRNRKHYKSLDEEVAAFASHEIQTNPGTAFRYSDIGVNIAGRVLEVVSKKRFDMLIKQKLLSPLGMRQTSFTTMDGSAPNPSSGARSTALEYMAFLKMLLNNGQYNGKQILSEASIAELRKLETANLPMNDVPKAATGYQYTLGAWALESNGTTATVLSSPGLVSTWPAVDFCRRYAFLIFTKELPGEQKHEVYEDLKKLADTNFANACN
jgi:CubicO group peptidase (beta-lactamase class C family)